MDSYRVSTEDVPKSSIASGTRSPRQQQRCDSFHCHEGWWGSVPPSLVVFSWSLDEGGAAGTCSSRQRLLFALEVLLYTVVQYYPINVILHNEHLLHSILSRAHFLWTKRTGMLPFIWMAFQVWFEWASPGFVHSDVLSKKVVTFHMVPVQQSLWDCISGAIVAHRKFHGVSNALRILR